MFSIGGFLLFTAGLSVTLHYLWRWLEPTVRGTPPGPIGLPLLGNVMNLFRGKDRHQRIGKTGKLYGGIYTSRTGASGPSVFVTSYKIFREATIDKPWTFSDRPPAFWMKDETTDRYPGIIAGGVDEVARNIRKFSVVTLRNFGFGKASLQEAILRESDDLNEEFRKLDGKPINPRNVISNAAANVIGAIALGRTYKQGDESLKLVNDSINSALLQIAYVTRERLFPILRYFPMKGRNLMRSSLKVGKDFINNIIKEHETTRDPDEARDYIDVWLGEQSKNEQSAKDFAPKRLPNVLLDLFAGGYETTTTCMQWIFAMLLHHPDVQDNVHLEIDANVGPDVQVKLEHRDALPYLEAVILETLRMFPLVPLSVPRCPTEDTTLGGYNIPKGTRVLLHIYSITHDEELWKDPEEFIPERFIEDGALKVPEHFVPFGAGRRSCIGEQLARKEIFLLLANILRCFKIRVPHGKPLPSLDLMQSAVIYPRPFSVVLEER